MAPSSQNFIFFVTEECAQQEGCYNILGCKGFPVTNTLAY